MDYPEIRSDTLAAAIAFVLFFIIADVLSTVLVLGHYGPMVIVDEENLFVQLMGINGLAAIKLGIMIFLIGLLFVFSRYQASIGDVLIGLAAAGALCAASNLYFICHGFAPTLGLAGAQFFAGLAISIAFLKAMADANITIMNIRIRSI